MRSTELEADEVSAATDGQERKWGFWQWRDIGIDGDVYMRRLTIVLTPWFSLKFHKIFRPDKQRELHDHPWSFVSFVLRGSYVEDTVAGPRRIRFFNFKPCFGTSGRHSIRELSRSPVWTLVFTGPKRRVWGFWVNGGTRFIEWDKYEKLYGA